jgi:hypothetical protein
MSGSLLPQLLRNKGGLDRKCESIEVIRSRKVPAAAGAAHEHVFIRGSALKNEGSRSFEWREKDPQMPNLEASYGRAESCDMTREWECYTNEKMPRRKNADIVVGEVQIRSYA